MKTLALTTMILLLTAGLGLAQDDPFGDIDTLYLDHITAAAGQECVLNVNIWHDEELGGLTIPLAYPNDKLDFIDIDFAGGGLIILTPSR